MKSDLLLEISGNSNSFTDYNLLSTAYRIFISEMQQDANPCVSLVFCSEQEMREVNRKYRGVDKTTDVLSFPAEQNPFKDGCNPGEVKFLGEILIDTNYVLNQKDTDSFSNAVLRVFVHGLLHLIGFDHINTQQRFKMQEIEENIMNIIKQDGDSGR